MNERLQRIIEEHSVCMPHGEFTHDSECIEHENWFKAETQFFYNLALEDVRKEVSIRAVNHECRESSIGVEMANEDYEIINFIDNLTM